MPFSVTAVLEMAQTASGVQLKALVAALITALHAQGARQQQLLMLQQQEQRQQLEQQQDYHHHQQQQQQAGRQGCAAQVAALLLCQTACAVPAARAALLPHLDTLLACAQQQQGKALVHVLLILQRLSATEAGRFAVVQQGLPVFLDILRQSLKPERHLTPEAASVFDVLLQDSVFGAETAVLAQHTGSLMSMAQTAAANLAAATAAGTAIAAGTERVAVTPPMAVAEGLSELLRLVMFRAQMSISRCLRGDAAVQQAALLCVSTLLNVLQLLPQPGQQECIQTATESTLSAISAFIETDQGLQQLVQHLLQRQGLLGRLLHGLLLILATSLSLLSELYPLLEVAARTPAGKAELTTPSGFAALVDIVCRAAAIADWCPIGMKREATTAMRVLHEVTTKTAKAVLQGRQLAAAGKFNTAAVAFLQQQLQQAVTPGHMNQLISAAYRDLALIGKFQSEAVAVGQGAWAWEHAAHHSLFVYLALCSMLAMGFYAPAVVLPQLGPLHELASRLLQLLLQKQGQVATLEQLADMLPGEAPSVQKAQGLVATTKALARQFRDWLLHDYARLKLEMQQGAAVECAKVYRQYRAAPSANCSVQLMAALVRLGGAYHSCQAVEAQLHHLPSSLLC